MANVQYYGIKYPFTVTNDENYFTDVNYTLKDKVNSLLMHVIFTPKGQKIRDPEFGTNLIKFIFEPNDNESWESVKNEIMDVVKKYINGVTINDISMLETNDDSHQLYVRVDYTVSNGIKTITDSLITKV